MRLAGQFTLRVLTLQGDSRDQDDELTDRNLSTKTTFHSP